MGGQPDDFLAKGYLSTDLGTRLNRELRFRHTRPDGCHVGNPGISPLMQNRPFAGGKGPVYVP